MGRTSLFLIIGFNLTFMFMGFRLATSASAAYQKYCDYLDIEQAGLAMESCANIAISHSLLDTARSNTIIMFTSQTLFNKTGSSFTLTQYPLYDPLSPSVQIGESLKVTGTYPLAGSSNYLSDTTFVRVTGNSFSQYVFYSVNEGGIQWLNNEICWGRYHTQDNLYVNGNPDFKGKVTTKKGLSLMSGTPQFEQGITKADISIPAHLDQLTNYGSTLAGGAYYQGVDTYVQFMDDGHVVVRAASVGTSPATVWGYTSATAGSVSDGAGGPSVPKYQVFNSAAALASSGVLLVQDAALHVKGELNGKITLGCIDSQTGGTKSQVWIDSSIAYASAVGVPSPPPSYQYPGNVSNSMLGIVATNTVTVSQNINHDNTKAQLNNLTLNASIFSQTSGFCAENAGTRTPGLLHLVGGLQQLTRGLVTQNGKGFTKDYDWDKNLAAGSPKGYPSTPFVVQNWIDLTTIPPDFWDN